jgi:DNA-directed RNA polymerase delta subunit
VLEKIFRKDKNKMSARQKKERLQLKRTIAARDSRLRNKREEVMYMDIIKSVVDPLIGNSQNEHSKSIISRLYTKCSNYGAHIPKKLKVYLTQAKSSLILR